MLAAPLRADLANAHASQLLKSLHPPTQTVVRILAGQCSCDLVRPRLAAQREDERHLRERYRRLNLTRPRMIEALERHRRGPTSAYSTESTPRVLASFVAEHARNAGTSLYYLYFGPDPEPISPSNSLRRTTTAQVRETPQTWLVEGTPTLVSRS